MTDNALVPLSDIEKMAASVAKSKLFGCKTLDEAMALMLVAQAEGMHPMAAVQEFHIIQGRPSRKADAILARFQHAGGSVVWHTYTDQEVSGTFTHPQGGSVKVTWNKARAIQAGLGERENYAKYPAPMFRSRCISEGVRTVYPGATGGMYTPEEIEELPPKEMGAAEVVPPPAKTELPIYPSDQFAKNLPAWMKLIADGTKTAEAIIATVSSKYTLSPEQRKAILVAKPAAPVATPTTEIPAKSKEVQDWQDEYARGEGA